MTRPAMPAEGAAHAAQKGDFSLIAPAASVILLRQDDNGAQVLMGARGADAAFMPRKFVFPGGRVDAADHSADLAHLLGDSCQAALAARPLPAGLGAPAPPSACIAAALRELHEETGLSLTRARPAALRFVFRAITPPGRSRRFDARFFLAEAGDFAGDMTGFSAASGELGQLQWLTLPQARGLDLPFITRVILAEVEALLHQGPPSGGAQGGVPFFDNASETPAFLRL